MPIPLSGSFWVYHGRAGPAGLLIPSRTIGSRNGSNDTNSSAIRGVVKIEMPLPPANVVFVYTHNSLSIPSRTSVQTGLYDHGAKSALPLFSGYEVAGVGCRCWPIWNTRSAVPFWVQARLADSRSVSCKHCWDKIPAGTESEATKEMKKKGEPAKAKVFFIFSSEMTTSKARMEDLLTM